MARGAVIGNVGVFARSSTNSEHLPGFKAQDIEWLRIGETIYIVQSRPYLLGN